MLERQQYDKELREQDSDYEDNLKVFDQSMQVDESTNTDVLLSAKEPGKSDKGKAKANPNTPSDASPPVTMARGVAKRQRPAMDPFVASGLFRSVFSSLSSAHDPRTGFVGIGEEDHTTSSSSHAPHVSKKSNSSHSTAGSSSDKGKKDKKKKKSKNINIPSI